MSTFSDMKKLIQYAAVFQLARLGLARRRRRVLQRQRRNRALGVLAFAGGGAAAWCLLASLAREQAPAWPSRKKLRREARRAEALRAREQSSLRPPAVHVEKDADTRLKVPLADVTR